MSSYISDLSAFTNLLVLSISLEFIFTILILDIHHTTNNVGGAMVVRDIRSAYVFFHSIYLNTQVVKGLTKSFI